MYYLGVELMVVAVYLMVGEVVEQEYGLEVMQREEKWRKTGMLYEFESWRYERRW